MTKMLSTLTVLALIVSPLPVAASVDADAALSGAFGAGETTVKDAKAKADGAVIRDQTTTVSAALNAATVKCSAADYSGPMLKVLVPALADLTVLNHRNTREGAPCVAAGRCGQINPQDVLKSGEGVDQIRVRVVLKKETAVEGDVCHVALVETVSTVIRGVPFFHERRQDVADRAAADCQ